MPVAGAIEAIFALTVEGEEEIDRAFDRVEKDYKTLQKTLERQMKFGTIEDTDRIVREIEYIEGALNQVAKEHEIGVDAQGVEQLKTRLGALRAQADDAGLSVTRMGKQTRGANNTLFAFADLAEDSAYGIRGMSNNIPFLVESFTQLQQKTGGTKSAFSALLTGLTGPAGLVALLGVASSVAVAFGDDIADAFTGASEEADRLRDKMEEVAGNLVDLQTEVDALTFSVSGEESVRAYAENMEEAERGQKAFVRALQQGANMSWVDKWKAVWDAVTDDTTTLDKMNALVDQLGVSPTTARQALKGNMQAQKLVTEAADNAGVSLEKEGRKLKGLAAESEAAQNKLAALTVTQEQAKAAMLAGAERAKDYAKAIGLSDEPLKTAQEGLRELLAMQKDRGFSGMEALAGEAEYLKQAMDALREDTEVSLQSEGFQNLKGRYEKVSASLEKMKEDAKKAGEATITLSEKVYGLTGGLKGLSAVAAKRARLDELISAAEDAGSITGDLAAKIVNVTREIRKLETASQKAEIAAFDDAGAGGLLEYIQNSYQAMQEAKKTSLDEFGYSVSSEQIAKQGQRIVDSWRTPLQVIGSITEDALGRAIDSASQRFGQQFTSALWSAFSGPDEATLASLEERRLNLEEQLANLDRAEMGHQAYAARVRAIHAELAETNKQLAYETAGVFEQVFRSIGDLVGNVIKQVIAEIAAAIAKAAILAGISALTGGSGTFMGFLSGQQGIGAALSSAPSGAIASPRGALATTAGRVPASGLTINVQGELRGRGQDLVASINTTQNANARRGRG